MKGISETNGVTLTPSFLTWLRCFEAAGRLGSFTRAASELHLTQSAVSQQIRHLEQRLERKLFHRIPGQISLTSHGRRLYAELNPALKRIEQAVVTIRAPEGLLYVSCSPSFANRWLVPRLGGFLRLHPDIDLHLRAEWHTLTREIFARDGLHAAIRYDPLDYLDLAARSLMDEYILPVASPAFVSAHEQPFTSLRTSSVTLLHDSVPWDGAPADIEWQAILAALAAPPVDKYRSCHFNFAELALAAARSGEGFAAARLALVLEDLDAGRLIPVIDRPVSTKSRYVLLSMDNDDPRVEAFVSWLHEECEIFRTHRQRFVDGQFAAKLPSIVTDGASSGEKQRYC
jgi:LysR family glycine cleavage system transcriptional activator